MLKTLQQGIPLNPYHSSPPFRDEDKSFITSDVSESIVTCEGKKCHCKVQFSLAQEHEVRSCSEWFS